MFYKTKNVKLISMAVSLCLVTNSSYCFPVCAEQTTDYSKMISYSDMSISEKPNLQIFEDELSEKERVLIESGNLNDAESFIEEKKKYLDDLYASYILYK